jgi:hypothetical protein
MHALLATWASIYSNSAVLRTCIVFAHVGGLLWGGGAAIVADRAILSAAGGDISARTHAIRELERIHRIVLFGLASVMVSGAFIFASDVDTFLYSRVYWIKMTCVVLLLVNGFMLQRAEQAAGAGSSAAWVHLRRTSIVSLCLWLLITLLGVGLTNA